MEHFCVSKEKRERSYIKEGHGPCVVHYFFPYLEHPGTFKDRTVLEHDQNIEQIVNSLNGLTQKHFFLPVLLIGSGKICMCYVNCALVK